MEGRNTVSKANRVTDKAVRKVPIHGHQWKAVMDVSEANGVTLPELVKNYVVRNSTQRVILRQSEM